MSKTEEKFGPLIAVFILLVCIDFYSSTNTENLTKRYENEMDRKLKEATDRIHDLELNAASPVLLSAAIHNMISLQASIMPSCFKEVPVKERHHAR